MDPKDKIDLRPLNKTKKQFRLPRPANLFKMGSTKPGRDDQGRFASGALKSKPNWMNRRLGALVVLLVAVVGGYYVFSTRALDGYSFVKNASQLTGGTLGTKTDGTQFRVNNPGKNLSVLVTATEMSATKQYCASVKATKDTQVYITVATPPTNAVALSTLKRPMTTFVASGKAAEVCVEPTLSISSSGGKVTVGTANFNSSGNFTEEIGSTISVEKVYGKTAAVAQDTTAPSVSFTSPTAIPPSTIPYVSGKTVNLSVTASDNVGVSRVEFRVGNTLVYTDTTSPYSYSWDSTSSPNRTTIGLYATAYDVAGNSKQTPLVIVVDNTDKIPPQLNVTSPVKLWVPDLPEQTAPVSGTAVKLAATATDNIAVSKVEFAIDGAVISTDTSSPYEYYWNSKSVADGSHKLTITAYDGAGAKDAKTLNLRVNNSGKIKIVYAGANFSPDDPSFESWVSSQINLMLRVKPYDKYKNNLSFRSINIGTVPCKSLDVTPDSRAWSCDNSVVTQKLAAAGVTYDKVLIANNSSTYGGVAGNTMATINAWASYAQEGGVHELSHTFGLFDEYITSTSGSIPQKFTNCYDGRSDNTYFLGMSISQMYPGCLSSNWYRSSDNSLMRALNTTTFSPAASKMLDYSLELYVR